MMPTIPLKRKVRTDAMAQMADTNAISQAAVPQGDIAKAPTLARTYRPPPLAGKGQGAGPQRQSMAMPQQGAPMAPKSGVLAGLASGLAGAKPPSRALDPGVVGSDRGPVSGVPGGQPTPGVIANPNEGSGDFGNGTPPSMPPKGPPLSPEAQAQADRDALDQQIRDFVSGRVTGANDVDTTEQEALIRDLVEGKTGAALVDQRARGGRAGFATSGAQQAIEGDIRKQAGQAASGDILDLRRTEQQRAFDNATKAIETESGMRSAASDDALRRMFLESLQAEAGLETGAGGSAADAVGAGVDGIVGAVGGDTQKPSTANAGGGRQTVSAPPAGFTLYQTLSNGDQLWKSPDDPGDNSTVVIVKGNA